MSLGTILTQALGNAFQPASMLFALLGVICGVTVGAIPGLTGDMAIAILLPFVYKVDSTLALGLLIGIYKGSMFGGSISAISFGVPGTPAAAATVEDGYPLAKKGYPKRSMLQALFSSVTGDVFSSILLVFLTIPMGQLAIKFGPTEFFALYVFSIAVIVVLNRSSRVKGLLAALIGIFIGAIGSDPVTGASRMTFGIKLFRGGFATIPVLVGTFAISELILQFAAAYQKKRLIRQGTTTEQAVIDLNKNSDDQYKLKHYWQTFKSTVIGSIVGTFVGILPGAGSSIAAYLSYGLAQSASKNGKEFGKGALEGVAAPEAANSATCGASVIPLLAFGIPGSATAALIGAAMTMQGINPGPTVFSENKIVIYTFFIVVLYASFFNLGISRLLIPLYAKISKVDMKFLIPSIFILAVLGCYVTSNSVTNVIVMLLFGAFGLVLRMFKMPLGPFILGYIIGPSMERSLRQSLSMSGNNIMVLFQRPIAIFFYVITIVFIVVIFYTFNRNKKVLDKGDSDD